jgi:hypothetical protein
MRFRLARSPADWWKIRRAVLGFQGMSDPEVISRTERDGGYIETLDRPGFEIYYRSCAHGCCRYSSDMWQAELYLDHLLAR